MGMWPLRMCFLSQTYRLVYQFFPRTLYLSTTGVGAWGIGPEAVSFFFTFLKGELSCMGELKVWGREIFL